MPKKFASENTKAVAARARKAAAREEEVAKKNKEAEEAYWQDDNKSILKKQQRKDEKEKKKQEQLEKKASNKALIEEELKSIKPVSKHVPKITQASIQAELEKQKSVSKTGNVETHIDVPLEENINHMVNEGEVAQTVTEAISVLSVSEPKVDLHPERRLKAAFAAFEEETLPRLKIENPTLRMSQLKQLLRKEWLRSPSNPVNKQIGSSG